MRLSRGCIVWSFVMIAAATVARTSPARAQDATPGAQDVRLVEVVVQDTEGNDVGSVAFLEDDAGLVTISVDVEGLPPGKHGIHVHETGNCDPASEESFSSASGHFNPTSATHGAPPAIALPGSPVAAIASPEAMAGHAGDLGNITVGADELGRLTIATDRFTLGTGPTSLHDADGSALVIHADPDDLTTDPSGNSGARIACAVVFSPEDGTPAASPVA